METILEFVSDRIRDAFDVSEDIIEAAIRNSTSYIGELFSTTSDRRILIWCHQPPAKTPAVYLAEAGREILHQGKGLALIRHKFGSETQRRKIYAISCLVFLPDLHGQKSSMPFVIPLQECRYIVRNSPGDDGMETRILPFPNPDVLEIATSKELLSLLVHGLSTDLDNNGVPAPGSLHVWRDAMKTVVVSLKTDVLSIRQHRSFREVFLVVESQQLALHEVSSGLHSISKSKLYAMADRSGISVPEALEGLSVLIASAAQSMQDNDAILVTLKSLIPLEQKFDCQTLTENVDVLPVLFDIINSAFLLRSHSSQKLSAYGLLFVAGNLLADKIKLAAGLIKSSIWETDGRAQIRNLSEECLLLMRNFEARCEKLFSRWDSHLTVYNNDDSCKSNNISNMKHKFDSIHSLGKRCSLIRRILQVLLRWDYLQSYAQLPVLQGVFKSLADVYDAFRIKFGKMNEMLEHSRFPDLETDVMEFEVHMNGVDLSLQTALVESFSAAASASQSMTLFRQYAPLLAEDTRSQQLDKMYFSSFRHYVNDLEAIQTVYERRKTETALTRGAPATASAISWSYQLLRRIEKPMRVFMQHKYLMQSKDRNMTNSFKLYNRLAQTLLEFQELWHRSWTRSANSFLTSLEGPVLILHPSTRKLHVNMDASVLRTFREIRWIRKIGLRIPEEAHRAILAIDILLERYLKLADAVSDLNCQFISIPPALRPMSRILYQHVVDSYSGPRSTIVTWTSVLLDKYIQAFSESIKRCRSVLQRAIDIHLNRVHAAIDFVQNVDLACLDFIMSSLKADQLGVLQAISLRKKIKAMVSKRMDLQIACNDVVHAIKCGLSSTMSETTTALVKASHDYKQHCFELFQKAAREASISSLMCLCSSLSVSEGRNVNAICHWEQMPKAKWRLSDLGRNCTPAGSILSVNVALEMDSIILTPSLEHLKTTLIDHAETIISIPEQVLDFDTEVSIKMSDSKLLSSRMGRKSGFSDDAQAQKARLERVVDELQKTIFEHTNNLYRSIAWKPTTEERKLRGCYKGDLDQVESLMADISTRQQQIDAIPETIFVNHWINLSTSHLKRSFKEELEQMRLKFLAEMQNTSQQKLQGLQEQCIQLLGKLKLKINRIEDFADAVAALEAARELDADLEFELVYLEELSAAIHRYGGSAEQDASCLTQLYVLKDSIRNSAKSAIREAECVQGGFIENLHQQANELSSKADMILELWKNDGPAVEGLLPSEAAEKLRHIAPIVDKFATRRKQLQMGWKLFGLNELNFCQLDSIISEVSDLRQLYSLYCQVAESSTQAGNQVWETVKRELGDLISQFAEHQSKARKIPKNMRGWAAYEELRTNVDEYVTALSLLQALAHPMVKHRHWKELQLIIGTRFDDSPLTVSLKQLIDARITSFYEEIEDLCNKAIKEAEVEQKLESLQKQWENEVLTFDNYKDRGLVVLRASETTELLERLEDSSMLLSSMYSSRFSAPFRHSIQELQGILGTISETLNSWIAVQSSWNYMDAVFSSGDLSNQLPEEANHFSQIDEEFMRLIAIAHKQSSAKNACIDDELHSALPCLLEQLEICQKGLASYLETKRSEFPRFYFVSDSTLLEILSHASDPKAIIQHFQSGLFDSLANVTFESNNSNRITEMWSKEGEKVPLVRGVDANGPAETWLARLVHAMQQTIRILIRKTAADVTSPNLDVSNFIFSRPAQIALIGLQMRWNRDITTALVAASREEKGALTRALRKTEATLRELVSCALRDDLSKIQRIALETCITVYMHQKEATEELVAKRIRSPRDFEWLRHCRVSWRQEKNTAIVSICDVDLEYSYEYLGVKERLVITPLTDVCYVTLTQALGMFLGGAPAGPAGTGKTETTKDLGATLGKYVVVFNCSDQMDHKAMGKIFKGLAQSGLWGCFDEFNRINLDVLSVCAQQVSSVLTAIREQRKSFVFTDGSTVPLDPRVGFFITMNPGYAGRQELPENLKVLFRGVTMMVPNRRIIMKVKLAAAGFQDNDALSKKFDVLYALCEQQLSKQPHYDFGLRNILSVLRTAGHAKRMNPTMSETELIMQTLRDMNMSKLVADDVPLFLSLIQDLFPGEKAERSLSEDVREALERVCIQKGLQLHPTWIRKCMQLYETTLVRHGVMVVGPTGSGKTTAVTCVAEALTSIGQKTVVWRMNPKSITAQQMFGRLDATTGDWTEGVFAVLWRRAARAPKNQNVWIVLDGPVDAVWIENLNTVLDDNKVLTLANGDRVLMTPNMRLIFEPENLRNASPATVSRAGIIYFSASELGWEPVVETWLSKRTGRESTLLRPCFNRLLGPTLEFIRSNCSPIMNNEDICLVMSLLTLLEGLFGFPVKELSDDVTTKDPGSSFSERRRRSSVSLHQAGIKTAASNSRNRKAPFEIEASETVEIHFLYCLAWSIGGLLDVHDRKAFDKFLRTISKSMPEVPAGSDDTIFEYQVCCNDDGSTTWRPWEDSVPKRAISQDVGSQYSQVVVPTADTIRYEYLLSLVHAAAGASLLVGGPGTAKTTIISGFLSKIGSEHHQAKSINLSSLTTPVILQKSLESIIEKRQGRIFGPPGGKEATVFIDDLSMPAVNEWGDQLTSELLRQILEDQGLYSIEKPVGEWKQLQDLRYVAAMNTPGFGRNEISGRLRRQFCMFYVTPPSDKSIQSIYGNLMKTCLTRCHTFSKIQSIVNPLVSATIKLWRTAQERLLPTPDKVHYNFTMHELSKVFQGISKAELNENGYIKLLSTEQLKDRGVCEQNVSKILPDSVHNDQRAGSVESLQSVEQIEVTAESEDCPTQNAITSVYETDAETASQDGRSWQEVYLLVLWAHEIVRVFSDKLIVAHEQAWIGSSIVDAVRQQFGSDYAVCVEKGIQNVRFASFFRDAPIDENTGECLGPPPREYEAADLQIVKSRIEQLIIQGRSTSKPGEGPPDLVLFDDAVEYILRIARVLSMERGSAMLVGVGGSGKQSLALVSAHLIGAMYFKIPASKSYGVANLLEDLKLLYKHAALRPSPVVFLITEASIKEEVFLEYFNQILQTGEVPGLFSREEIDEILCELRPKMKASKPGTPDTWENLYDFFIGRVRDRLHLLLCISPTGKYFVRLGQQFPSLISSCTISWFLPWPKDALLSVAESKFTKSNAFEMLEKRELVALQEFMANVHLRVGAACGEYSSQYRRSVHVTPKSFLSALETFKDLYTRKRIDIEKLSGSLEGGLKKIAEAKEAVGLMRAELTKKDAELAVSAKEAEQLLREISDRTEAAEKEKKKVSAIVDSVRRKTKEIAAAKSSAEADLAGAQPALDAALTALNSITHKDITSLKSLRSPPDVIKRIFDCVLLLRHLPVHPPKWHLVKDATVIIANYDASIRMMGEPGFLQSLLSFPKDSINDETVELLQPYFSAPDFNYEAARKASGNVAGLCNWAESMCKYHEVAKFVEPKIVALRVAEKELQDAENKRDAAETELAKVQSEVDSLSKKLESAILSKKKLEDDALSTREKLNNALTLMSALGGEEIRWAEQRENLKSSMSSLIGDCAVAASFISYMGPFNRNFRENLMHHILATCDHLQIQVSSNFHPALFLADETEIGQWAVEGLPSDPLSIQNGILVTRAPRSPLLLDPQGQGRQWIIRREGSRGLKTTSLDDAHFRMTVEEAVTQGLPLLIENIEQDIDPTLDNILERNYVKRGSISTVQFGDKELEVGNDFQVFLSCRVANPRFPPETFARTSLVDFTVTSSGLEDQLLSELILREKKELEEQRRKLVEEVQACKRRIATLEANLLTQLSNSSGSLIEDTALVDVLAATKETSKDVANRMQAANATRARVTSLCEEFRPVAHRAMLLYFVVSDFSAVNCMYQSSLNQFMQLYWNAIDNSTPSPSISERIAAIMNYLTTSVFEYVQRGLFEEHKMVFSFVIANKINIDDGSVLQKEFETFLALGTGASPLKIRKKPKDWIPEATWNNILLLSERLPAAFGRLPDALGTADSFWKKFCDAEEPETMAIPEYDLSPFLRLCLVRAFREDRVLVACSKYVSTTLGARFVQPLPVSLEGIYHESRCDCPVICILSPGADPTRAVEELAKRQRVKCVGVSMGQGQEILARQQIATAADQGFWVLLQNAHLGLKYLAELEGTLAKGVFAEGFRLWITAEPHADFPIGLLQRSIKITNEAPSGIRAGLKASYQLLTQDNVDAIPRSEWRQMLFALCFLHAIIQERRRFGPLGWNVPYEFNNADLSAAIHFLQSHMQEVVGRKGAAPDWATIRYMISKIHYGGKITDDQDRAIMDAYASIYLNEKVLEPDHCIFEDTKNSSQQKFLIPNCGDIEEIRSAIDNFPLNESPELFGLHKNAVLTCRTLQVARSLAVVKMTLPIELDSAASSLIDTSDKLQNLTSRMPSTICRSTLQKNIESLSGGALAPLNIHLRQEIERMNKVIDFVKENLRLMHLAAAGSIPMTDEIYANLNCINADKLPSSWIKISWEAASLANWMEGLEHRYQQLHTWLHKGRPKAFWFPGFFNPQGFLSAVKQEVTRKHISDKWSLNDVCIMSQVTRMSDPAAVRESPSDGAFIYGLFLEGASWSTKDARLADADSQKLFTPMPIIHVTAVRQLDRRTKGIFEAPCYRVTRRTGANFITKFMLRTLDDTTKWILRGVALLCSTD